MTEENKGLREILPENPIALAKMAKKEIRRKGDTDVRCPRCGGVPELSITPRGERTIVSCPCGYVHDVDINL